MEGRSAGPTVYCRTSRCSFARGRGTSVSHSAWEFFISLWQVVWNVRGEYLGGFRIGEVLTDILVLGSDCSCMLFDYRCTACARSGVLGVYY